MWRAQRSRRLISSLLRRRRLNAALSLALEDPKALCSPLMHELDRHVLGSGDTVEDGPEVAAGALSGSPLSPAKLVDICSTAAIALNALPPHLQKRMAGVGSRIQNKALELLAADDQGRVDFLNLLRSLRVAPNARTLNIALDYLLRQRDLEDAEDVYRVMQPLLGKVVPNVYAFNVLLEPLCGQENAGQAVSIIERMRRSNLPRNSYTYNCALGILGRGLKDKVLPEEDALDGAEVLLENMRRDRIEPNLHTFQFLMSLVAETEDPSPRVLGVLDKMDAQGVVPDGIILTTATKGLARSEDQESLERIFRYIREAGITPDVKFWTMVLHMYAHQADADEIERIVDHMESQDMSMDTVAFNVLLRGAVLMGLPDYGLVVLQQMQERGCPANHVTRRHAEALGLLEKADRDLAFVEETTDRTAERC